MSVPVEGELSAHCALHPEQQADATCTRCGNFLCARCSSPGIDDQRLCDACVERGAYQASTRSKVALGLAVFTFVGAVPGFLALHLARSELRDISAGKRLPDGAMFARLARTIALLELFVLLAAGMALASQWLG